MRSFGRAAGSFAEFGDRLHHLSDFVFAVAVTDPDVDGARRDSRMACVTAWIGLTIDFAKLIATSMLISIPAIPPNASQSLSVSMLFTVSATVEVVSPNVSADIALRCCAIV